MLDKSASRAAAPTSAKRSRVKLDVELVKLRRAEVRPGDAGKTAVSGGEGALSDVRAGTTGHEARRRAGLSEGEVGLYRRWITDRRRLEKIVGQTEQVSAAAAELLLRQATPPGPPRPAQRRAAQVGGYMVSEKCGTSVQGKVVLPQRPFQEYYSVRRRCPQQNPLSRPSSTVRLHHPDHVAHLFHIRPEAPDEAFPLRQRGPADVLQHDVGPIHKTNMPQKRRR